MLLKTSWNSPQCLLLWSVLAVGGSPVATAEAPAWAESSERALLQELTWDSEQLSVSFERVGRWRFDRLVPASDMPLSQEALASGRRRGPAGPERFELSGSDGAWTLLRQSHPETSTRAYLWQDGRQFAIMEAPENSDPSGADFHVVVTDRSRVLPNPFLLQKLGYFLLPAAFPADAATVAPSKSLVTTLDAASLVPIPSKEEGVLCWGGTLESRGKLYSLIRKYEVEFVRNDRGELSLMGLFVSHSAHNLDGVLMRQYSDTHIRFGEGWSSSVSPGAGERRMDVLEAVYDDDGQVKYCTYEVLQTVPAEKDLRSTSAELTFDAVLVAVGISQEDGEVIEVLDQPMGLQYRLGSSLVLYERTVRNLDEPIESILTPSDWVRIVARQDWGDE